MKLNFYLKNYIRCYLCLKDYLRFDTWCNQNSTTFWLPEFKHWEETRTNVEDQFQNEGQQHKPQELCFAWEIKSGYKERRVCYSAADGL